MSSIHPYGTVLAGSEAEARRQGWHEGVDGVQKMPIRPHNRHLYYFISLSFQRVMLITVAQKMDGGLPGRPSGALLELACSSA